MSRKLPKPIRAWAIYCDRGMAHNEFWLKKKCAVRQLRFDRLFPGKCWIEQVEIRPVRRKKGKAK